MDFGMNKKSDDLMKWIRLNGRKEGNSSGGDSIGHFAMCHFWAASASSASSAVNGEILLSAIVTEEYVHVNGAATEVARHFHGICLFFSLFCW